MVAGVLLFFEEFALFVGVLACLLSSKSCSACCVICFWLLQRFTLLVGLLGLLRGGLLSLAFSVSINKLKIYEQHFMIQFYKLWLLGFLV